jgi:predicted RNA-binding Zn ribbon-like protein
MNKSARSATTTDLIPAYSPDLCVDFANTRYWRGSDAPTETLSKPDELLRWCEQQHVAGEAGVVAVRRWWQEHPLAAETTLREALALRETIYRLLFNAAEQRASDAGDLARFSHTLSNAPPRVDLATNEHGFAWRIERPFPPGVAGLLAPVLWSAGDLLVGARRERLRHCANERCLWLFVDESKAGTRRWCSMSACGNRAKAQRHYHRQKRR